MTLIALPQINTRIISITRANVARRRMRQEADAPIVPGLVARCKLSGNVYRVTRVENPYADYVQVFVERVDGVGGETFYSQDFFIMFFEAVIG